MPPVAPVVRRDSQRDLEDERERRRREREREERERQLRALTDARRPPADGEPHIDVQA